VNRILKGFHKDIDETQGRLATNNKFIEKLLESTKGRQRRGHQLGGGRRERTKEAGGLGSGD
jgi:hypothetical protein